MFRRWIKRGVLALAALVVVAGVAVVVWWRIAGDDLLYGMILPDAGILLADQEVPPLTATALRRDLEFLRVELPELHIHYDDAFPAATVARRLDELEAAADSLTPERRALELFGVLALGGKGTGHTMIFPIQKPLAWRIYPLATFWFDDGLFVTAAGAPHAGAVGSRIVAIGGRPVSEVLDLLASYAPGDNSWSRRDNVTRLLTLAEPLIALGLAAEDGLVTIELEDSRWIRLKPMALTSWRGLRWSRRIFAPVEDAWSPADPRPRAENYAIDYRVESKTLLVALHQLENQGSESLSDFAARLDALAREVEVERFVIDLRSNSGGNNELAAPLMRVVSDHPVLDREGRIFVLIGRRTFSAAANLACALERRTRAVFVGETSGFAPDHYGDAVTFLLPGSKVVARLASRYWREDLPGVARAALEPDLPVEFRSRHHFDSMDPALAVIGSYRPAPRVRATDLPADVLGSYLLAPHHRVRLLVGEGGARLAIDEVGPYALTDLYVAAEGGYTTDIRGLTLAIAADGSVTLEWHGASWSLEPMDVDQRLPYELLEQGEIERGVAALRATIGITTPGAHLELAINRLGYRALADGRVDDALEIFTVNSELFPKSANTWDSLGDALRAADQLDAARDAYQRALVRNPTFRSSRLRLAELGEGGR